MPPRVPRFRPEPPPTIAIPRPVRLRYYVLWKPYGILARFGSGESRPTLERHVPLSGLFPVGRMDAETEGLLLLTDDPRLCTSLARSASVESRLWLAQVDGDPTPEVLESLRHGPGLGTRTALPLEVRAIAEPDLPARPVPIRHRANTPTRWLELRVFEGWARHVRRLTAAVGHPTLRLVQWGLGPVDLAGMAPGQLRELTPNEIRWAERVASEAPERRAEGPVRDWRGERLARQGRSPRRDERAGEEKRGGQRREGAPGQGRSPRRDERAGEEKRGGQRREGAPGQGRSPRRDERAGEEKRGGQRREGAPGQGRSPRRDERAGSRKPASGGARPGGRPGQATGRKRGTPAAPNPRKPARGTRKKGR